ncbi:bifunctional metallophosphatase/5'-nucleotidase [Parabacteroides bouchesdurhonensis]|uniref:bifunctional metallophosphatase/5'-nucleotidase n=1 Tax=Parabacteroides bouchesdurhonensis TaxID=1936995 RepID=UPI000E4FA20F|nr:5'-nucleotidase C-terminal domain-containing protein [Parabacteroides bouchesdurhonensis]RHJ94046.1 hypothetical protein DW095_03395 [Bacteroides sp. AM07-16]
MKQIQFTTIIIFLFLFLAGGKSEAITPQKTDTIAIISLNDFHGAFVESPSQGIPGAGNVYSQVNQLKERYPFHIVLSAGDNFGGSFFSNLTKGEMIPYFFKKLGISISALGNHEFDNGQEFLKNKWKEIAGSDTLTYVCANLNNSAGRIPNYTIPYLIKEIKMPDGQMQKLAIVGLIASSAGSQTKKENVEGLTFRGNYNHILDSLEKTTELKDVNWQILLAHIGTQMTGNSPAWDDIDSANLILPTSITSIASGHSHKLVSGYLEGIPVVQGAISGKYISVLRYVYNQTTKSLTPIEPYVIKVESVIDHSPERIEIDQKVDSILNNTKEPSIDMALTEKLATVISDEGLPYDRGKNAKELMALGSYVCMSYAQAYRERKNLDINDIVLGFSHMGGIRNALPKGDISVITAAEVLPFTNKLKVYNLKGKEIMKLVEAGLSNPKGYLQTNNIIIDTTSVSRKTRIFNIRYVVPGREEIYLGKEKQYPVVVDEFITTGGDGYSEDLFPKDRLDSTITDLETTPSFFRYLKKYPTLDNNTPFKAKLNHYRQ